MGLPLDLNSIKSVPFSIPFRELNLNSMDYVGQSASGEMLFQGMRDQNKLKIAICYLLNKEESLVWDGFKTMLFETLKTSATKMLGFYGFHVITFDLSEGIKHFHWGNLSELIVNHSRKLKVSDEQWIQFGGMHGILKKRMDEMWGKIEPSIHLAIYREDEPRPELILKKIIKMLSDQPGVAYYLLIDLSQVPILSFPLNEEQLVAIEKIKHKFLGKTPINLPKIDVYHQVRKKLHALI